MYDLVASHPSGGKLCTPTTLSLFFCIYLHSPCMLRSMEQVHSGLQISSLDATLKLNHRFERVTHSAEAGWYANSVAAAASPSQ